MSRSSPWLRFRCTGCGNCCRDPLLPLTVEDAARIAEHTGDSPLDFVRFVSRADIQMEDEPEWFASLRAGPRLMVLRHQRGRCRYLGADDRCTIYEARPLGCRVFPLDAEFGKRDGKLRRLRLIDSVTCEYELDGRQRVGALRELAAEYAAANQRHLALVAEWNRTARRRRRRGLVPGTARAFLRFLGLLGDE